MTPFRHVRRLLSVLPVVAATALLSAAQQRTTPKFYDDDPIARAVDTQDASKAAARERSLYYDALANLFGRPGEAVVGRAADVNTIDEVPDIDDLWLNCSVNGERRTRFNTRGQIYKAPDIIEHFSRYMPLRTGDVFATGSAGGVAVGHPNASELFLRPGDLVAMEIEPFLRLRTKVV